MPTKDARRDSKLGFSYLSNLTNGIALIGAMIVSLFGSVVHAHDIAKEMTAAANVFLQSLGDEDRKKVTFEYSTSMQVMALESVLHEMENLNPKRDPSKYHLFIFGEPSTEHPWGWRIEGHHLSVSFTVADGQAIASTPLFLGASPAKVAVGNLTGLRVLGEQEDLGRRLVRNLSVKQKEVAVVDPKAPRDVINGPGVVARALQPVGLLAKDMTDDQQGMLRRLIDSFVHQIRPELAAADLKEIEDAGFDNVSFAWMGFIQPEKPHYFRVQGPTFIVEYDNTQSNANHVHIVWRDFKNDFGKDLLKQHYQSHLKLRFLFVST